MDELVETLWPPPPQMTATLTGHPKAEAVLSRALASRRLPHAWLITGPKGIGKATLACRFSRHLLAIGAGDQARENEPDMFGAAASPDPEEAQSLYIPPSAPIFGRIAAGGHGDQKIIRRSLNPKTGKMRSEIVVDDVRAAGNFLHKTSAEGGYRVIIVDSADEMNRNAANALLKSLEEPPPKSIILLVSHAPGRLLATIRSRCRHLPLQALSRADFGTVMDPLFTQSEAPEISQEDMDQLFHLSGGAPGAAIHLAQAGGIDLYAEMIFILESLSKGRLDVSALHGLAGKCSRGEKGETFFKTFSTLLLFWISAMVRQERGVKTAALADTDTVLCRQFLGRNAKGNASLAALDHWVQVWEKLTGLFAQAEGLNLDRKQVVLDAFYTMNKAFPR